MAVLGAVTGLTDFFGDPRIRGLGDAWQHAIGNVIMACRLLRMYRSPYPGAMPEHLQRCARQDRRVDQ